MAEDFKQTKRQLENLLNRVKTTKGKGTLKVAPNLLKSLGQITGKVDWRSVDKEAKEAAEGYFDPAEDFLKLLYDKLVDYFEDVKKQTGENHVLSAKDLWMSLGRYLEKNRRKGFMNTKFQGYCTKFANAFAGILDEIEEAEREASDS